MEKCINRVGSDLTHKYQTRMETFQGQKKTDSLASSSVINKIGILTYISKLLSSSLTNLAISVLQ